MLKIFAGDYSGKYFYLSPEEFREKAEARYGHPLSNGVRKLAEKVGLLVEGTDLFVLETGVYSCNTKSYRGEFQFRISPFGNPVYCYRCRWNASEGELQPGGGWQEREYAADTFPLLLKKLGWYKFKHMPDPILAQDELDIGEFRA